MVRLIGNPKGMKNLIVATQKHAGQDDGPEHTTVSDLATAYPNELLDWEGTPEYQRQMKHDTVLTRLTNAAPNLAPCVKNSTASSAELWAFAATGVLLQATAIIIPALGAYYWKWDKAGSPVPSYGYPCFFTGTLLVIGGMMGCGHVIEGITEEHVFTPKALDGRRVSHILRLQKACTIGDLRFESFVIFNHPDDLKLRMSLLGNRTYRQVAAISSRYLHERC